MREEKKGSGFFVLWVGVIANALLIAVKFLLGLIGRSQALIADAVHSVTDFATDVMAFAGHSYSLKGSDEDHPFGHGKIETLMSLFIGLVLVGAGVWLGFSAVTTITAGEYVQPNLFALIGAFVSILVKEWMYRYTVLVGRRIKSQVLIANAWHHRSDAFSSVAVVIGVGAALVNPAWSVADALAALIVCFLIIKVGLDIVVPAFRSAADAAPDDERLRSIADVVESVDGVRSAHDIRARSYSHLLYVEVHVVVDPNISVSAGHKIAKEVRTRIKRSLPDILDVIVHIDPDEESAPLPEKK